MNEPVGSKFSLEGERRELRGRLEKQEAGRKEQEAGRKEQEARRKEQEALLEIQKARRKELVTRTELQDRAIRGLEQQVSFKALLVSLIFDLNKNWVLGVETRAFGLYGRRFIQVKTKKIISATKGP